MRKKKLRQVLQQSGRRRVIFSKAYRVGVSIAARDLKELLKMHVVNAEMNSGLNDAINKP